MTALRQFGAIVEAVQKGEEIGGADPLHVVPESLTGELIGSQWQEACQHQLLIPGADLRFACRRDTTVQGSQQKILPDRRALVTAFGYVAIHGSDHIQSLGDGVGCDRAAKFPYRDFFDLGTEEALLNALGRTEIV